MYRSYYVLRFKQYQIKLTHDVFGDVLARHFTQFAEANLVDDADAALVLCLGSEVLDDIVGVLQVLGDVAADPVGGIGCLALHQVTQDGAASVVGRGGPGQADGAEGGVCHYGVHHRARRSWTTG